MAVPDTIRQTSRPYTRGRYLVHPRHADNPALQEWIKQLQFEHQECAANRMRLHSRKRNRLYSFYLPAVDKEVVLKVSQISGRYRWYRRLNLLLLSLIKNYSLNAYYGAIGLEKINANSIKVIAHWTCKKSGKNAGKKSYLLYEKINATLSVFELCNQISKSHPDAEKITMQIASSLAGIIRHIHKNNIRHGDPHAGNFLLCSPLDGIKRLSPASVSQMKFALIDLDKVDFVNHRFKWLKKLFDLRCIRRFRIHTMTSHACLACYLNKPPNRLEKAILKFWMKGGFNLYKWLKPGNKPH